MTAAGGAGGVTGITTTAAPTVIADCNTKFATNSITHAIRVHVKAESLAAAYNAFPANTVVGDPLNDQRQVPEWGTPADADTYTASAVTAAEGVVEQLSLFPETFRSPVAKTNRWETEVQTTGALDNSATVFEVRAIASGDVAFSVAGGTIATSAYSTGDGTSNAFLKYVGARVTVCFGIDEDGVPQAADQTLALTRGRGNCESRAIYEYGHNAATTAAAANYVTVRTPFSQIPSLGDLVFFDWLDLYGPSGLVNRNGVADTTDDYGGSGAPKIFVCSPGAGTPAGSEVKTQWDPDTAWESFPDEHGHARFGTGMASMSVTSAVNAGESTNAVQVTKKSYWDEAHFYRECSAKGSCDRSSGKCDCFPGYAGTGCAQLALLFERVAGDGVDACVGTRHAVIAVVQEATRQRLVHVERLAAEAGLAQFRTELFALGSAEAEGVRRRIVIRGVQANASRRIRRRALGDASRAGEVAVGVYVPDGYVWMLLCGQYMPP